MSLGILCFIRSCLFFPRNRIILTNSYMKSIRNQVPLLTNHCIKTFAFVTKRLEDVETHEEHKCHMSRFRWNTFALFLTRDISSRGMHITCRECCFRSCHYNRKQSNYTQGSSRGPYLSLTRLRWLCCRMKIHGNRYESMKRN